MVVDDRDESHVRLGHEDRDDLDFELDRPTKALVELAQGSLGHMSPQLRVAGIQRLRAKLGDLRRARARRAGALAAAACLAATLFFGGKFVKDRDGRFAPPASAPVASAPPLSFRVDGAEILPGGSVIAAASTHPVIRFSDGSEVSLAEGGRFHVRAVFDHGAHVTLDEGDAHAYVVHSPDAHWLFDAGPFVVTVTGTAFALSWHGADNRLDLRLENGSVTVSGPVSDAPIARRAGQWLTVHDRHVLIRDIGAPEWVPDDAKIMSGAPPSDETPAERPNRAPPATASHRWAAALAAGKVDAVVAEAERLGIDSSINDSSADDLSALADAARYTRHTAIAERALNALRRRFPGSRRAEDAAFHLGRLAESGGGTDAALRWFDRYLKETPSGTYASEALGRKMTIMQQLSGVDGALSIADEYLRRFPNGTYAQAARALTRSP